MASQKPVFVEEGKTATGVVRSMTGFASTRRETPAGELTVSLRSVNHRSLDLHFHGGSEFASAENELRELIKRNVRRGHIDVRLTLERAERETTAVAVNRAVLAGYVAACREVAVELGLNYQPNLEALLTLRGVLSEEEAGAPAARSMDGLLAEVLAAAESCLAAFNEHREREGDQLRAEMLEQAASIAKGAGEIREIREAALPHFQDRLRGRLRELLGDSAISEARLIEEAAILADRSDIEEELVRLGVHTGELEVLLRSGGEVGKRLDFLLQEMNREANTMLAKSGGAGAPGLRISNTGLAIKASIERIREQALNLE